MTAPARRRRTRSRSPRALTEIEAYALGLVEAFGECTAYRVRRAFAESPSAQGRGSAGSIYPVLRRLEERGLVTERAHSRGKRRSRLVSITDQGREALRAWLAPPLDEDLGLPLDPLRARIRFLGVLPRDEQRRFLQAARQLLERLLDQLEERARDYEASGTAWEIAMARGAVGVTRARLDWLTDLEEATA